MSGDVDDASDHIEGVADTVDGFKDYYSEAGKARQFERLALVKLRPVAGDAELGARVSQCRDGFVYSGAELDLENILHLRRRQAAELATPESNNAKYSPGGLRVAAQGLVQRRQVVERCPDTGMVGTEGHLKDRPRAFVERLGLRVAALGPVKLRQVVERLTDIRMVGAEGLFPDR